ncbi:GNAT family N-acetyltransferase [Rugosimonospora africana]|uniref:Alanine acetyltransferase n=1 Tax=Rugosimonospora africana TaxID=556532 RepID=A0A8J3QYF4_9ACTN|nr:GNAT family protein [Rugosimonospora africana]GIH18392.1 alanine acetyltransferase [Rugosimonospora africana]
MGESVKLRPVLEADLAFLYYLMNDPDGGGKFQWYGWHDAQRVRNRWVEDGMLGPDAGTLVVASGDRALGLVGWRKIVTARPSHCWNLGIVLAPDARGHGHGTRAQRLLVEYLFAHTPVNRVEAATEVANVAEQRSLERAGFTREGVLRGYGFRDGQWRDAVLYSVLRADLTSG